MGVRQRCLKDRTLMNSYYYGLPRMEKRMSNQAGHAEAGPARPWPADQVERWPIERLIPYANNARLHSSADLDKIATSIRKWGWTMPVLADEEGTLLAGHARIGAAAK